MDYGELQVKTETVAQEELQKAQAKETERLPLVSDQTEPEPALNGQSRAGGRGNRTLLCPGTD